MWVWITLTIFMQLITLLSVIGLVGGVNNLERQLRLKGTILGDDDLGNSYLEDGQPVVSKPVKKKAIRRTTNLRKGTR